MTTFAPAPKPKAALPASRTEIQKVSDKQRAKREKNGERFIVSTIAKTSLLDPHFRTRKSIKKERAVATRRKSKTRDRNDPRRIYGPQTFRDFLHSQSCLGCGYCFVEQAHIHCGGQGRKDDWQRTVPLCGEHTIVTYGIGQAWVMGCHHDYDHAKRSWAKAHDLPALAAQFWNRWLLHCGAHGWSPDTGRKPK